MKHKIVLMKGGTETLEYFSRQLAAGFSGLGYELFFFDLEQTEESAEKLASFAGYDDTVLVTFNFNGLDCDAALYDGFGNLFWNMRNIPCINIVVDHPFFYPELYKCLPERYYEISIDHFHMDYLKKYYPKIKNNFFLPLAGTSLYPDGNYPTLEEREIDVLFTGNFVPKENFEQYIYRLGSEYAEFYLSIIEELKTHPEYPDDLVIERRLLQEFPDASKEEMRETMSHMIFIDTYIRNYFREKVIQTLVDAKIHVHCIGHGWHLLPCKYADYLTYEKNQCSLVCLERMTHAKISVNVMPWFKDGVHDRVFNAMANGSVALTDHSRYLDNILTDGQNACFYDLAKLEELPQIAANLLEHPEKIKALSDNGYRLAIKSHTWLQRAEELHTMLLCHL